MKYLAKNKFMPEIHLRQPGLTCSACGPFTKHKEGIHKFKETVDLRYIYQNEFKDFKDLTRRIASDKILHDKTFNISKNSQYEGFW